MHKSSLAQLLPVMLCFFAMGFVDLVGTASNYVQQDLLLSDAQANIFPSLVFFWFLIFAVPTGLLMNKIGRKRTVLLSLGLTLFSLLLPLLGETFPVMLAAFSLLGIGNALMQTSLNPLVSSLIRPQLLPSTLTFGQFVKAIASFLAPILASWGAVSLTATCSLGWRVLFPIYAVVCLLSLCLLAATPIPCERESGAADAAPAAGVGAGICSALSLLARPFVLLCFLGIMCHVGIDVGTNTVAPKLLMERLSLPLEQAALATSVYFIFRTLGCLSGALILRRMRPRAFLAISVAMLAVAMTALFFCQSLWSLYLCIALIGYGNSNVFSIVFSSALSAAKDKQNEVSGLMIMGLFGGTVFPLLMGLCSTALGSQAGSIAVMAAGVVYLAFYTTRSNI